MSTRRTPQLVAAGIATAVAGATLAVTHPAPAAARPATTSYVCTFPELGEVEVLLTVSITNLPTELTVDIPVPANQWNAVATVHLDDLTTSYLLGRTNAITASVRGLELLLANTAVPLPVTSGIEALPVAEALDVPMAGTNIGFTPNLWADNLPLELPEAFTLDLGDGAGSALYSVACEWGDGDLAYVGEIDVVKQSASIGRKLLKNPVKSTKRAKVLVTVVSQTGELVPGAVMASMGGRNLAVGELKDGKVTLRLPKLKVGKHRVTLKYLGSRIVDRTARNVTVKVVAP